MSGHGSVNPRTLLRGLPLPAIVLLAAALAGPVLAQSPQLAAVVSAASFQPGVSRGSLASIFGTALAGSAEVGNLGSDGSLPTQLAGSSVEINGKAAPLIYVSPNQINLLIPDSTAVGVAQFVVKSPPGASAALSVPLQSVAPGIFLLSCLRADRGAARNGVTYQQEPFQAETPDNPGDDKRTRLSIFATGVRFAGAGGSTGVNVAAFVNVDAVDRAGRVVPLDVEYAGPAPGFFGLDQINAVVPAKLSGIGLLQLRITAGGQVSNTASVMLTADSIAPAYGSVFRILTLAGAGQAGNSGDGGQAAMALLRQPLAVAVDRQLNLYIADSSNHVVRRVAPNGVISRFAGTGEAGSAGDGGAATQAQLQTPAAVAVDEPGNVYVADTAAHRVRRIDANGVITAFAGAGTAGNSGDGGLAVHAQLGAPSGVAVNPYGSVLITNRQTHSVRKVTGDGFIQTVAGTGEAGFAGDGGEAVSAALNSPACLEIGADNTTYLADALNYRVRRVTPGGVMGTVAGSGRAGNAPGEIAAAAADLGTLSGIAMSGAGELVVSDSDNHVVRVIDANCQMRAIAGSGSRGPAGDGGPALQAQLSSPAGIASDPVGDFYLADAGNNRVRKLWSPLGDVCGQPGAIVFDPAVVVGGQSTTGYVRLTCPTSAATTVQLVSAESAQGEAAAVAADPKTAFLALRGEAAALPGAVTIPAGETTAAFPVTTAVTSRNVFVEVTGSSGGVSAKGAYTAIGASGAGVDIISLQLAAAKVPGGSPNTGLIRLGRPAPAGGTAIFLSTDQAIASVQPSVVVSAGQVYVEFLIRTTAVDQLTRVTVVGSTSSASQSAQFDVLASNGGPGFGKIFSLTITPGSVTGGEPASGTVTLESAAPAGGVLVNLASSSTAAAVPASVVVPAGSSFVQFDVSTSPVEDSTVATITATSEDSQSASLTITTGEGPGPQLGTLSGLTLNPTTVNGGQPSTGTITLTQAAPQGGVLVNLSSNQASAVTPASLIIPAGSTSRTFTVTTAAVEGAVVAQITATSANATAALLTINPGGDAGEGTLASLSLSPGSVTGLVENSTATVTLAQAAPSGGVVVNLSSNNAAATVPASVTIPATQLSANFTVTTNVVTTQQQAVITGTAGNSVTDTLTINPALPTDGTIASFTILPNPVSGGESATGTITLSQPAPLGGVQVDLSSDSIAAVVPPTALVPAGATSTTVTVATTPVLATTVASVTATSANSIVRPLTVEPLTPTTGTLASLDVNPSSVTGLVQTATGVVSLPSPAPPQGISVTLSSDNAAAVVPPTLTVPGGATSEVFTITTTLVVASTPVMITATSANSVSDTLTVEPPVPSGNATIATLSLAPASVNGGQTSTGTVTLTQPAPLGGITVALSSNSVSAVVQPTVLVTAGTTSANFSITTTPVLAATPATITATATNSKMATLTINPLL
jgi:uncharacterized protein (TIGR03437 family)